MCTHTKKEHELLDTIIEIVADIRHDVVMERYKDAKEKILLLDDLLKVLNKSK